jgi:hypothetical protein
MRLNKNKVLFILIFYTVFLVIFSTETILTEFMNARRELLIKSDSNSETFFVTKSFWNTLKDKKEFVIQNEYYDLKSYQIIDNKVLIHVVHDTFELTLKKTIENLTKKAAKNKKRSNLPSINHLLTEFIQIAFYKLQVKKTKTTIYCTLFKDTFSLSIFEPPKFVKL